MATSNATPWWASVTSNGTVYSVPDPLPADKLARFAKRFGIRFVVMFGSCARGENGPQSDIDIAIMPEPRRRPNLLTLYGDLVPTLMDDRLDIVDLRHASPLLAWHVACEGRLLYAANWWEWVSFCTRAVKEWDDVKRFERYYLHRIDRTIERLRAT
jgi:uncharacterized protein